MNKKLLFLLLLISVFAFAQSADAFMQEGVAAYSKSDYTAAISAFKKCEQAARSEGNKKTQSKALNNLGNAYSQTGRAEDALRAYQKSLSLSQAVKDYPSAIKTSKNIGVLYAEQKDFEVAMRYYAIALKQSKQIKDQLLEADCLNNMGVVYEQQQKFTDALNVYLKALAIYRVKGDDWHIAMTLNNLAIVYKCLANYKLSLQYYSGALAIAQKQGDAFMVAATRNNMGNVYALMGDYSLALQLAQQAFKEASAIQATDVVIESCDGIAIAYEKLGQYPKALEYRRLYQQKRDSFINTERSAQLADMQVKYETVQKENRIRLLTKDRQIQELKLERRNRIIIMLAVAVALLLLTAYFWRGRQLLKARLEKERVVRDAEEQERRRLAKDIHDDLGSGLTKINFLSELILSNTRHLPEVVHNSMAVQETARKMVSNMRDLIWALSPENTTLANLVARIREYTSDYLEDTIAVPEFSIPDNLPQHPVNKESHRQLLMVVKESLNNSTKHSGAAKVLVGITVTDTDFIMEIADDGQGFVRGTGGNGLNNMESRVAAIGGTVTITGGPGKGTAVKVTVPLKFMLKAAVV